MSQQPFETAYPLTYTEVDLLADHAEQIIIALWLTRASLPEADWRAAMVDALVALILMADEIGQMYGFNAPLIDDPGVPVVSDGHQWRRIVDFDPDAAQDALERREGPLDEDALRERITKAVDTVADRSERVEGSQPPASARQLVRNETIQAAQEGNLEGLNQRVERTGESLGWRRGVEPDCCAICFYLWKEGYVYDVAQPMWTHTGCRCSQIPTKDRLGRHGRRELDDAGRALLDRYYAGQIENTKYRRQKK